MLAKRVIFTSVNHKIEFEELIVFYQLVMACNAQKSMHSKSVSNGDNVRREIALLSLNQLGQARALSRTELATTYNIHLLDLVDLHHLTEQRMCSNPRDRIYGILGVASLAHPSILDHISVRYDQDLLSVYKTFVAFYLQQLRSPRVLYLVVSNTTPPPWFDYPVDGLEDDLEKNWPSWVPRPYPHPSTRPPRSYHGREVYQQEKIQGPVTIDGDILRVSARLVDTFKRVANWIEPPGDTPPRANSMKMWHEIDEISKQQMRPYPTGGDLIEVTWRTLCRNAAYNETPAPASTRDLFSTWKNQMDADPTILFNELEGDITIVWAKPDPKDVPAIEAWELILHGAGVHESTHLAVTDNGYLALVPYGTRSGDQICFIDGAMVPLIVRPRAHQFEILGPAYVHGLMDGEVLQMQDINVREIEFI